MDSKLFELPASELFEKFGVGKAVPGSGSAAALQGMLSAKLVLTVIHLTSDPKRENKHYLSIVPELNRMAAEIKNRIYPALENLFQQDSDEFYEVIKLREARNEEKRFLKGRELAQQAQNALMPATENLIAIASLCVELADFSIYLIENGFKSARGDSNVSLNSAASAIGGCICIANLNLLSIDDEKWVTEINRALNHLRIEHERLLSLASEILHGLEKEAEGYQALQAEIRDLQKLCLASRRLSNGQIETVAKKVQNILWKHKDTVWKRKTIPEKPRDVLQPQVAFEKLLKYDVLKRPKLDSYDFLGEAIEVAGIIDNNKKVVGISKMFPVQVQNFTLAHELGHALFHRQAVLHRDRPMDGSGINIPRDLVEIQADKFATYFLMPAKQVEGLFHELFKTEKFVMTDDTVFALNGGSLSSFRAFCASTRDLSRIIASTESYQGEPITSIADLFGVSIEAMAIRLEELDLVEFETLPSASFSY